MCLNHAIRLLTLLAFALFGGAMPVAASGDHVVICGADGAPRIVFYDFETGTPVETEVAEAECQDCFGITPILIAAPITIQFGKLDGGKKFLTAAASMLRRPDGRPSARAPPSMVM